MALDKKIDTKFETIGRDIGSIKTDVEVLKVSLPALPQKKAERIKDGAAGGTVASILLAVIIGVWEYFKSK